MFRSRGCPRLSSTPSNMSKRRPASSAKLLRHSYLVTIVSFLSLLTNTFAHSRHGHRHHHTRVMGSAPRDFPDGALLSNISSSLLDRRQTTGTSSSSEQTYTCGPGNPCSNGACCGESGYCGYGPTYCGNGCTSNCDAHAECGQYAAKPGTTCPLNVCCSQFGLYVLVFHFPFSIASNSS